MTLLGTFNKKQTKQSGVCTLFQRCFSRAGVSEPCRALSGQSLQISWGLDKAPWGPAEIKKLKNTSSFIQMCDGLSLSNSGRIFSPCYIRQSPCSVGHSFVVVRFNQHYYCLRRMWENNKSVTHAYFWVYWLSGDVYMLWSKTSDLSRILLLFTWMYMCDLTDLSFKIWWAGLFLDWDFWWWEVLQCGFISILTNS